MAERLTSLELISHYVQEGLTAPSTELDNSGAIAEIAKRGKTGVTSLYAEAMLAIEDMPRVSERGRYPNTILNSDGAHLLTLVDQAIELNPLYDTKSYQQAKDKMSCRGNLPPSGTFLTDLDYHKQFPERGLGALKSAVEEGVSAHPADCKVAKGWRTPAQLIDTMELNDTIDRAVMNTFDDGKLTKTLTPEERIRGLISLAKQASAFIANVSVQRKPKEITRILPVSPKPKIPTITIIRNPGLEVNKDNLVLG